MYFKQEFDIRNFEFWQGGKDTLDSVIAADKLDELEVLIEEIFYDSIPEDVEINDFLWFDRDYIYERLGI